MRTQPVRRVAANPREANDSAAVEGSFARSATRLVALFEALAKSAEGMSLAELSARLVAPKSSLLGILRSMVAAGYMEHGHGLYRLGPKSFRLAADILAIRRFPAMVRPILQDLAAKSGETAFLVLLDQAAQRMTYADIIDSANPVRYTVPTGTTRPLYVSAGGQMLLAWQEPAWIDAYIRATRLEPLTPRTIIDPEKLRERLAAIRRDGFAVSLGETVPGAAGVAAPIVNADGTVAAGLLLGAPIDRFEQRLPELKRLLRVAAARAAGIAQVLVDDRGVVED
ncbi:MAG TPA: IclR family transcriptional regulator [Stellaceae bacterium]|nr:IclR family transcriptional regulator [Stellaceae bacterium]